MTVANQKFADYVTSGAFNLSLSRNQISELSMLADAPQTYVARAEALERRGLIEAVPQRKETDFDGDHLEYRLTASGVLVVQLLHSAGLTNQGANTLADEVEALRAEVVKSRAGEARALSLARSFKSRLRWLQDRVARMRECAKGDKIALRLLRRDPNADVCTKCLTEELEGIVS